MVAVSLGAMKMAMVDASSCSRPAAVHPLARIHGDEFASTWLILRIVVAVPECEWSAGVPGIST